MRCPRRKTSGNGKKLALTGATGYSNQSRPYIVSCLQRESFWKPNHAVAEVIGMNSQSG